MPRTVAEAGGARILRAEAELCVDWRKPTAALENIKLNLRKPDDMSEPSVNEKAPEHGPGSGPKAWPQSLAVPRPVKSLDTSENQFQFGICNLSFEFTIRVRLLLGADLRRQILLRGIRYPIRKSERSNSDFRCSDLRLILL